MSTLVIARQSPSDSNVSTEAPAALPTADQKVKPDGLDESTHDHAPTIDQLQAAVDSLSQGLCMFGSDSRVILCNSRYAEIHGLPPNCIRPGMTLREIVDHRFAGGAFPNLTRAEYLEWIEADISSSREESVMELQNGRVIAIRHHRLPDGGWLTTHDDITERRRAEARIVHMARHDGLTNLPNRIAFNERLDQAMAHAGRGGTFAVLCLDLDGFKFVNDSFGHGVGDKLLVAVSQRLRSCLRDIDTAARFGGDEFAVIQYNLQSPNEAAATCERIVHCIAQPFHIDGCGINIGVSIGIAIAPEDGTASDVLLRNADLALYLAKSEGRGTFRFFEPEMDAKAQLRRTLEHDLRRAVMNGEFEVRYQPQVNLESRRVSGMEALVRWHHPVRGLISPEEFVPVAEETGLVVQIGDCVLRQACKDAAGWPDALRVAVNVSAVQFRAGNLLRSVQEALAEAGLPAQRLELEITESVLLKNNARTVRILKGLRSLGVTIALDDFGTGYSSLHYLNTFPFDKIKIDRSFVSGSATSQGPGCIVRAVAGLGMNLGIPTTAEGVETNAQLARLVREGCTEAQGFLFSKARPNSDVPDMLASIAETFREVEVLIHEVE